MLGALRSPQGLLDDIQVLVRFGTELLTSLPEVLVHLRKARPTSTLRRDSALVPVAGVMTRGRRLIPNDELGAGDDRLVVPVVVVVPLDRRFHGDLGSGLVLFSTGGEPFDRVAVR